MGNKQQKFKYNSEEVVYDESKSTTKNFDKDEYFLDVFTIYLLLNSSQHQAIKTNSKNKLS